MRRDAGALVAAAPVFAALGDEQRLRIVGRLSREGPLSIARLTDGAQVTRQAVTKHLHVLEGAGLARGERRGREVVWVIEPRSLRRVREHLDLVSRQWDDAIERLRAMVEANG
jgi:DNA-binding transcriptional ArsR family regulator